MALGLTDFAIAQLGHSAIVASTFGLGSLHLKSFDSLLLGLNLGQHSLLALPLCAELRTACIEFGQLAVEGFESRGIVLSADGLAFDFESSCAVVEHVNILGHGVHLQAQLCSRLVHKVDGLVGQKTACDVAVAKFHSRHNSLVLDTHLVVVLVAVAQTTQDGHRVLDRRLIDHHLLETALQGLVLLKVFLVFVEGCRTNRTQLTTRQSGFQNIGSIHCTITLARTHKRVNLVDKQQYLARGVNHLAHNALQTLLELTLVLCARNQRTHIQRVDKFTAQVFGHLAVDNSVGDTLGNGGLTHARLSHKNGVVLGAARQNLQHAANLVIATNHGVEFATASHIIKVDGVASQRIELMFGSLRVHSLTLAQLTDGGQQLLLNSATLTQHTARLATFGKYTQQ